MAMEVECSNFAFFDFNEGDSDLYTYTSDEFCNYFKYLAGNGIIGYETGLENYFSVGKAGALQVRVKAGEAFVAGHYCVLEEDVVLDVEPHTEKEPRSDGVFIRVDRGARRVTVCVKKGTLDETHNEQIDEMCIGGAYFNNNSTSIGIPLDRRAWLYPASKFRAELYSIRNIAVGKADAEHTHTLSSITGGEALSIADGGTGAHSEEEARQNLHVASESHSHMLQQLSNVYVQESEPAVANRHDIWFKPITE